MTLLLLLTAVAAVTHAQTDCSEGACYPRSSDLLVGRADQLHASSTCGLTSAEVYCTPYQQRKMKCCPCDSRNPNGPLAHTVQEMLSTSGPERWWQSRKEVTPVTLQLDLNNLFNLDNLVLNFKGPRPSAMVMEKSMDNGRTWQTALYLATNCKKSFPGVSTASPLSVDQTYCYTLPSTESNPYQDHTIEFSPLRQYPYVPDPSSPKMKDVTGLTGLRITLTELGDVPRLPGRALSRFFALKEMKVMGSCMCHGHASHCLLEAVNKVSPQCDCQHNTAGVNCERCDDLYNDLPWRPAEERATHTCKRCECNNHARSCHFDPVLYEASGQRTGGVCEGCLHHTTGPKCDQCLPGYQPNPRSQMDRPDACIRCVCNADGTVNGGSCDDNTGLCQCKLNVEGPRCDQCKRGYYGLSASNPLGCSKCTCFPEGTLSDVCDSVTGQCPCRPHFHGLTCEVCARGYWKPPQFQSCELCRCDPTKSFSDTCDQLTGQCQCRPGFGGRTCNDCPDNTHGNPLIGCKPCLCNPEGTQVCNKLTGSCLCRPGITGPRCDSCTRGHCDSFPICKMCPSCFFSLDSQRQALSLALEKFTAKFPPGPGGSGDLGKFEPRIRALEARLNFIWNSVTLPPSSARQIDDALSQLDKLRDQVDKVSNGLSTLAQKTDLSKELDKLQDLLDNLNGDYNVKKETLKNTINPSNAEAFTTIKNAYDGSKDAANKAEASKKTVKESADNREDTLDIQEKQYPNNTRALKKLNDSMASGPDLTPVAKKVCGSVRSKPCTPLTCEDVDLCPPEGSLRCERGSTCVGALPIGKMANSNVKDVKDRLEYLSNNITEAAEKLQDTQDSANDMRESTKNLSNKIREAGRNLEDNLKEAHHVVKELKEFLSDPSSNLTHIQNVSDLILKTKLPLSPASLKKKLDELKNLATNLPDSTSILNKSAPQLDAARKLLQEAQDTRNAAQGVKDDVDELVAGFDSVEDSLADMEDRLQNNLDSIDKLHKTLIKNKDQLRPAEKTLDDVTDMINPIKPQLDELKDLLQNGTEQAEDAQETADKAEDEAAAADQEVSSVQQEFDRLKDKAAAGQPPSEVGPGAEQLAKLKKDVGTLANTTDSMLNDLEGKADSLKLLQDEILQKSTKLEGLEAKLKDLVEQLQKKAHDLSVCQG
ncbi:laminin subunit beta-3-like [Syngnathoides biaculeatus]|uniref:laminin subunit beta-3-like n=1 Tax=Syngnathoides biaculeatus TaxID=300417 RepID=UPI002ADDE9BF|nr:laminin subunit beta-3-like [Syngnathoides biaculeatus]XP_061688491.1 laminin subunit beta-3-like [Syngnathoides biaculeatus]